MKPFGLALAAVVLAAQVGTAHADDQYDSGRAWIYPKFEVLHERWPKDEAGSPIYGQVTLDCAADAIGFATDCRVKSSQPSDPKLETAALALAPLYKSQSKALGRAALLVSVLFDTNYEVKRNPLLDEMALVWPRAAAKAGAGGWGVLHCTINKQGFLQNCSVVQESTPSYGFGEAVLKLTPPILFKPATRHGEPVEAEITFRIGLSTNGSMHLPNAVVLGPTYWSKAPSAGEIMAVIDKQVRDKSADGRVVLMCALDKKTGKIGSCSVANASEGMAQFKDVAKALSASFEADPKALADIRASLDSTHTDAFVFLPFSFPDMTSPAWNKRYLTHIQWTRLANFGPGVSRSYFPEAAVKAGLKSGDAVVDCLVADNGGLSDCQVKRESTADMGFGAMAKTIAEASAVNPWNDDGLPSGGARVEAPIHMTYDPKFEGAGP